MNTEPTTEVKTKAKPLNTEEALAALSNNDQIFVKQFTDLELVLARIGNRLEYLSRIIDTLFVSEVKEALTTKSEAEYRMICSSILEKMIAEVKKNSVEQPTI